jgi:hypothetical protein
VNDSGRVLTGFPKTLAGAYANSPILGDVDHDGFAEIVVVSGTFPSNSVIQMFRYDGSAVTGWPKTLSGLVFRAFNAPIMGDADGDRYPDVLMGFENTIDGFEYFYAWKRDGTVLEGWPKLLRDVDGYGVTGSPVLGDFDDDDTLDCALSSNAYWMVNTDIYVWDLGVPYSAEKMEWPMFRHDPQMTACFKSATSGVEDSPKPQAASCKPEATIVRGALNLQPAIHNPQSEIALLDISGRKVLDLRPGANDVSHLAPGVFFVRERSAAGGARLAVRRVVLAK